MGLISCRAAGGLAAALVIALAGSLSPAAARRVDVSPSGEGGRPDLAEALRSASAGDTLVVRPGVYPGTHVLPFGVSIVGAAGPDSTILDADGGRYVLYGKHLDGSTFISGLTLQNGRRDRPSSGGGGIFLYASSPVIVNNVFRDHLGYLGPGVYANNGSSPVIAYNVFHDIEGYLGGAIAAYVACAPLIYQNVIYDNEAVSGGSILSLSSSPVIVRNTIVGNTASHGGSAIYLDSSPALIEWNVLAENSGSDVIFCMDDRRPAAIRQNLLWRNESGPSDGRCPVPLGLDGNREGAPEFVGLEDGVLWRRAPELPDTLSLPGAGAAPWDRARAPAVPDTILVTWKAWRDAHPVP